MPASPEERAFLERLADNALMELKLEMADNPDLNIEEQKVVLDDLEESVEAARDEL